VLPRRASFVFTFIDVNSPADNARLVAAIPGPGPGLRAGCDEGNVAQAFRGNPHQAACRTFGVRHDGFPGETGRERQSPGSTPGSTKNPHTTWRAFRSRLLRTGDGFLKLDSRSFILTA
jgi:hypothetical protein